MTYKLQLTAEDVRTIAFVGHRYLWSSALCPYGEGEHDISEPDAWAIREAFEDDTEGGYPPFPMLNLRSELADKLYRLWDSIV